MLRIMGAGRGGGWKDCAGGGLRVRITDDESEGHVSRAGKIKILVLLGGALAWSQRQRGTLLERA